jgi:integrase
VALDVGDVNFEERSLVVTQVKKGGEPLPKEDVPSYIITSPTSKSLKNYYDNWRPKVDTGESDAFFLNTEGRRFDPNCLGSDLSDLGKQIWPQFTPYTMRRWFATEFLIANDFNIYATAKQLGDRTATVERHYIDKARARTAMGISSG